MYTYTLLLLCIKGISIKHYRLASKGCCLATADWRLETIYGLLTGDCRLATGDYLWAVDWRLQTGYWRLLSRWCG